MISMRFLLCAVTILIPLNVQLYEFFGIRWSHSTCKVLSPKIVLNMSCTSRIINRTRHGSLDINLKPEVELHNVYIITTFYYKFRTVYRPHLIKVESELCQFLKNNSTSKVLLIVAGMWKRVGNILDPCPVKGYRYLKDFDLELDMPVQILPAGDWRIDSLTSTIINNTKIQLLTVSEYFEIKTKTALQWKK